MVKKNKTFYVTAKLLLEVCIPITANGLEEDDFVNILGDYNDGSFKINGIFEAYKKIEL